MLLCLGSCTSEPERAYLARVGDAYLYADELGTFIPATVSREDSSRRAKVYINSWVREQVVLEKARFNLRDDDKRFESKLQNYLNELMIFEYENQLVKQNLDTVVTDTDLRSFYETNSANFVLKDYVVRVRYALFDSETPLNDFLKKFKRYNDKDSLEVRLFCAENAKKFISRSNEWVYLNDLVEEVPLPIEDSEEFLRSNSFIDFVQSGKRYLLKIEEYKLKDNVSPFELVEKRIRNTIINERKITLLEDMRNSLFSEAINKNKIEILTNE
jgi:hypothetical protein